MMMMGIGVAVDVGVVRAVGVRVEGKMVLRVTGFGVGGSRWSRWGCWRRRRRRWWERTKRLLRSGLRRPLGRARDTGLGVLVVGSGRELGWEEGGDGVAAGVADGRGPGGDEEGAPDGGGLGGGGGASGSEPERGWDGRGERAIELVVALLRGVAAIAAEEEGYAGAGVGGAGTRSWSGHCTRGCGRGC